MKNKISYLFFLPYWFLKQTLKKDLIRLNRKKFDFI